MILIPTSRIPAIDLLRGLVMVLMALDHSRAFLHFGSGTNPTDLATTTPLLFATRLVSHLCAPVFVLLAGTAAYLYGQGKSKAQLRRFLFTRGLWLILAEATFLSFAWTFDFAHGYIYFGVVWAIGISMVAMAALVYLPLWAVLSLGILFVAGHNAFDAYALQGPTFAEKAGKFLIRQQTIDFGFTRLRLSYSPLPWLGCMLLGYALGALYQKGSDPSIQNRRTVQWALGALLLFGLLRAGNIYGDPHPWSVQSGFTATIISFLNVTKYPPSLLFFSLTLGVALVLLRNARKWQGRGAQFLLVFGRVPFFFYVLHIYLTHLITLLLKHFREKWTDGDSLPTDAGFSLATVYLVWLVVLIILYYPCKKYMQYKAAHRDRWWLSYL